jgi:hypothetical protein
MHDGVSRCFKCSPFTITDAGLLAVGCVQWLVCSTLIAGAQLYALVIAFRHGKMPGDLLTVALEVLVIVCLQRWAKLTGKAKLLQYMPAYLILAFFIFWCMGMVYLTATGVLHSAPGADSPDLII